MPRLVVEIKPLHEIFPYQKNARKIPQSAIDAVALSLKTYGWQQPIVIDAKGVIVVGHVRRLAALQLGWTEAPVTVFTGSAELARAYRLMDNRSHDEAQWDIELLTAEMLELKPLDLDLGLTGFNSRELDAMLRPAVAGEDEAPPAPEVAFTQPGDLWTMGEHRLLCGDATDADAVKRVCGANKAALCLTDPPYGVGETYATYTDTPENLKLLVDQFLPLAREHSERVLLTPGNRNQHFYPTPDWTLCWFVSAGTGRNPWGFSCWQPVLAYGKCPYLKRGLGSRPDALSLTESADNNLGHPCSKPVKVWSWFVERGSANTGDVVFDPFIGSGTTIIACDQLRRVCVGLEIDPKYCDVAVRRWTNLTGKQAYNQDGVCFPNV